MSTPRRWVRVSVTVSLDVDIDEWSQLQEVPLEPTAAAVRADVKSVIADTARQTVEQLLAGGYRNFRSNAEVGAS